MLNVLKLMCLLLALVSLPLFMHAQTQPVPRLAIISETNEAHIIVDVLTARLTTNQNVNLLERDEVARIHREQALSAANKNYLQLGKVLGADGLLAANIVATKRSTNLTLRLVAVKPGVILSDETFGWPIDDLDRFSEFVNKRLSLLAPKLSVLPKDAVPISVVRFRSPLKSADSDETERQLQTLSIERLTREPQLFALERQKLQALIEEKDLGNDASAFWSGAYLLEGAIDQTGFSKDTLTLDARLTPSNGGAPLQFKITSSRTNLAAAANSLALRIVEILNPKASVSSWNPSEEAAEFFEDAKWSYRWRGYAEAKQAADAAWALGKQDIECGLLRVRSEVADINSHLVRYEHSDVGEPANRPLKLDPYKANGIKPTAFQASVVTRGDGRMIFYTSIYSKPDRVNIDRALEALSVYLQLSQKFSESVITNAAKDNRKNSNWYGVGVETLDSASAVLEDFHFVPELAAAEADKLAELRASVRAVADWISNVPAMKAGYFVGARLASNDELGVSLAAPNIFRSTLKFGAFWYERPEDTVAAYRALLQSPAFCYIHEELWSRDSQQPKLVHWPTNDTVQLLNTWSGFVRELTASTNVLWQLEGHALKMVDATDEVTLGTAFTNLFETMFANGDALAANPVEVLYLNWKAGKLVDIIEKLPSGGTLARQYHLDYRPKLEKLEQVYRFKTLREYKAASVFAQQKKVLQENHPIDFNEFMMIFSSRDYTKAQAEELLPLIQVYRSNLSASVAQINGGDNGQNRMKSSYLRSIEMQLDSILHPREMKPVSQQPSLQSPAASASTGTVSATNTNAGITDSAFQKQKTYLLENQLFEPNNLIFIFGPRNYSKAQADELLPLAQKYRSNFLAKAEQLNGDARERALASAKLAQIVEIHIDQSQDPKSIPSARPTLLQATGVTGVTVTNAPEIVTNVLTIDKFYPLPIDRLAQEGVTSAHIIAHQWIENKVVLDVDVSMWINKFASNGEWLSTRSAHVGGVALFEPASRNWDIIPYPKTSANSKYYGWTRNYYSTTLSQGDVWIANDGNVQRYDKASSTWLVAEVSDGNRYQLFSVNGHLYAADPTVIFEIIDGGKRTRLLASTKRRPPASALDAQDLGWPVLFSGQNHSLRVATKQALYSWTGSDWLSNAPLPSVHQPQIFPNGVLFDTTFIADDAAAPQILLKPSGRPKINLPLAFQSQFSGLVPASQTTQSGVEGQWPVPPGMVVADAALTTKGPDLYALVNHSAVQNVVSNHSVIAHNVVPKDGYHATLMHFSPGKSAPEKHFLKFENSNGCPPLRGATLAAPGLAGEWILFASDSLIFGYEYDSPGDAYGGRQMTCVPGIWVLTAAKIK